VPRLNTKLWRELGVSRWQFIAVAATVMLGVATFHGSLVSYSDLNLSYQRDYQQFHFGDVWVRLEAAPDTFPRRLETIPGVKQAIGRIVQEIRVVQRNRTARAVTGRIISFPAGHQPAINQVHVVAGRYLSPTGGREALLESSFARANHYRVGDAIYPSIEGEEVRFRIVGIVQSPEYIFAVASGESLVPSPDTFGVMFIPQEEAEALFNMGGTINEVVVTTTPSTPEQRRLVAARMEPLTDRYGGEEPVTQEEQASNKLLRSDLAGYEQMAVILPLLFLTAAVLTLYTLLSRLVQSQRTQIGVLRAAGFTSGAVLRHYLGLALLPAVAGGLAGVGLGYAFAWWITRLYVGLISIPTIVFEPQLQLAFGGLGIAVWAGALGAVSPARVAARLPPATAMSQQEIGARALPRSARWFGAGLPLLLRLPLRNLVRRPRRTAYTVLGIALGLGLTLLSLGLLDSVEAAIDTYFSDVERYDIVAGFDTEQPGRIITRISAWPGVRRAEPTLSVDAEITHGARRERLDLTGLPAGSELRRLTTLDGRPAAPGRDEVLLGDSARRQLAVQTGQWVVLHYARNRPEFHIDVPARVGPRINQPIGTAAYMRMEDVQRLFAVPLGMPLGATSGVLISAAPDRIDWIRTRLYRLPPVAFVLTRAQILAQIEEMMRFSRVFTGILASFGIGLAFAVVFTAVSITLLERTRELATLRTLGFGLRRVAGFVTVENLALAAIGAIIGLPFGMWMTYAVIRTVSSEAFTLQPVVFGRTYVIALLGLLLLTLASEGPGLLSVRRMDLAAAAKEMGG
jgi:putative ABC transport system permease protein